MRIKELQLLDNARLNATYAPRLAQGSTGIFKILIYCTVDISSLHVCKRNRRQVMNMKKASHTESQTCTVCREIIMILNLKWPGPLLNIISILYCYLLYCD